MVARADRQELAKFFSPRTIAFLERISDIAGLEARADGTDTSIATLQTDVGAAQDDATQALADAAAAQADADAAYARTVSRAKGRYVYG